MLIWSVFLTYFKVKLKRVWIKLIIILQVSEILLKQFDTGIIRKKPSSQYEIINPGANPALNKEWVHVQARPLP